MIRVALNHQSIYHYDRPASLGPQTVRLRPAPHSRTTIESYSLKVTPDEHFVNWQQDPHSNYEARLVFPEPVRSLEIEVDLIDRPEMPSLGVGETAVGTTGAAIGNAVKRALGLRLVDLPLTRDAIQVAINS